MSLIEKYDDKILSDRLKIFSETPDISNIHFIYAGAYYFVSKKQREKLKSMILIQMKQFNICSSMLTMIDMVRDRLITKEAMIEVYKGKFDSLELLSNEKEWIRKFQNCLKSRMRLTCPNKLVALKLTLSF